VAMQHLNCISLFSGIGGLELGLKMANPSVRTVCYVENDPYAAAVLMSRMRDGQLDTAPIWDDVTTFDGRPWRGLVDIISGGFPCQDISIAGRKLGIKKGNRSGLWFEFVRIIRQILPNFIFVENVSELLGGGIGVVLGSLAEIGYDAKWTSVSAQDVGAPHKRNRVFCLAYPKKLFCDVCDNQSERKISQLGNGCGSPNIRDSKGFGISRRRSIINASNMREIGKQWDTEPGMDRVAHGVKNRLVRFRCLGNAVVPQQAALAFQILSEGLI
jgi:DNA (cytosine-5)-methyltransferase 1